MFRTPGHRDTYMEPESEEVLQTKKLKRARLVCKLKIFIPLIVFLSLVHVAMWASNNHYEPNNYLTFWWAVLILLSFGSSLIYAMDHFTGHSRTCCK